MKKKKTKKNEESEISRKVLKAKFIRKAVLALTRQLWSEGEKVKSLVNSRFSLNSQYT